MKRFAVAVFTLMLGLSVKSWAGQAPSVPLLDGDGQQGFNDYWFSEGHRAFALAPGGGWGWSSGKATVDEAKSAALDSCRKFTAQPCLVYALDQEVVFDRQAWAASWGTLGKTTQKKGEGQRGEGAAPGQRYPDLVLTSPGGEPVKLSQLRGHVVVLHFWASWCAPCQYELPQVDALYGRLKSNPKILFVPVQAMEPIAVTKRWAEKKNITLPLYDSGGKERLGLANGNAMNVRELAPVFPTTYVLDGDGKVVFVQQGPLPGWADYAPLLERLASDR